MGMNLMSAFMPPDGNLCLFERPPSGPGACSAWGSSSLCKIATWLALKRSPFNMNDI